MRGFFTIAVIAASTLTASVGSAAVVFNDDFSGVAGNISTSTPEVGSGPWAEISGRQTLLSGAGTAVRGSNTNGTARISLPGVGATDVLRLDLTVDDRGTAGRIGAGFAQAVGGALNGGTITSTSISINVLNSPAGAVRITRNGSGIGDTSLQFTSAGVVSGDTVSLVVDLAADTVSVLKNDVALTAGPVALGFDLTTSGFSGVGRLAIELGESSNGAIGNVAISTVVPEPTSALAIGGIVATLLRRRSR